jgi:transcriptional regulator with GAF, ATPase, and Fis domain
MTHETDLAAAFVELSDAMVTGLDLVDFLHLLSRRTVALLDVDAAGVMLADEDDKLRAVAASDENTHLLEMFSLQHQEGVCIDVYRKGAVEQTSTAATVDRWPNFSRLAVSHGYAWLCGIPLRHGKEIIGSMNLFRKDDEPLGDEEVRLAQALTDVATIALLARRETIHARRQATQLQAALDSRVLIEQAKGVLVERLDISLDEAFQVLRQHARDNNRKLRDMAHDIVFGNLELTRFTAS